MVDRPARPGGRAAPVAPSTVIGSAPPPTRRGLGAVDSRADRPAHVPSSAVTISTWSSAVIFTRRRAPPGSARAAGRRPGADPAADHDAVRRDDRDHVGDPDPEVAADLGEAVERARVAGAGASDGLLGRAVPHGRGDLVGAGVRLEAAAIAAAAQRPVRLDGLVAELAGGAVVALEHTAVDRDHAADAGPERQADHRRRAAAGTEPQLRKPEGPRVVDQGGRQPDASPTGPATGWPAHDRGG